MGAAGYIYIYDRSDNQQRTHAASKSPTNSQFIVTPAEHSSKCRSKGKPHHLMAFRIL
jgi:hypothetical protein